MRYFAKVSDGLVMDVIVAEPEFFNTYVDHSAGEWIETCYDGSFRKNPASIGGAYDKANDAFIPLKPFPDWTLNSETFKWDAPIPYPSDGEEYYWDEETSSWMIVQPQ